MLVHFTIYNTKHNQLKNYTIYRQKKRFYIFMGFQNANENEFHGFGSLAIWLRKSFGNLVKGFSTNAMLIK